MTGQLHTITGLIRCLNLVFYVSAILLLFSCDNESSVPNKNNGTTLHPPDSASIESLTTAIRENPMDASLFFARAELEVEARNIENAINDITIAIKLDSVNPKYYNRLAEYYMSLGQSGKAKVTLEKCFGHSPDNIETLIKLSEIYLYAMQYKESYSYTQKVEAIDKHVPYIYFLRGIIYQETQDTARAIENFQITVTEDPRFYNAYVNLGLLYASKRDTLAIAYYNNAIKIIPNSLEAHYNLAIFLQDNDRIARAVQTYNYILEHIDSTHVYSYFNLGYLFMEFKNDYETAEELFSNAIKYDSNYAEAYYNRGLCFELRKMYSKARQDYDKAMDIVPNYELSIAGLNRIAGHT